MDISEIKMALTDMNASIDSRIDDLQKQLQDTNEYAESLELKFNRQGLGGILRDTPGDATKFYDALSTLIRTGDDTQWKSMSSGSDPDGGYVVMPARSSGFTKKLFDSSPMRRLSRVESITVGDSWEEPIDADDIGASWVGESESRPATETAQIGMLKIPVHETYSLQPITQRLLDDSYIDVGAWVEEKMADKFARQEGLSFTSGDGVVKPRGFLNYPTDLASDATRAWSTIQHVVSGNASAITADALRTIFWSLRAPYRAGAAWMMNSNTAGAIDKLKDGQGNYLWRDSSTAGVPPTLLGHPVEFNEDMPDVAANSLPIAFANWKLSYVIVDKLGLRVLRDPYSDKPRLLIYVYKRVGGGLANSEAIKLMKISA